MQKGNEWRRRTDGSGEGQWDIRREGGVEKCGKGLETTSLRRSNAGAKRPLITFYGPNYTISVSPFVHLCQGPFTCIPFSRHFMAPNGVVTNFMNLRANDYIFGHSQIIKGQCQNCPIPSSFYPVTSELLNSILTGPLRTGLLQARVKKRKKKEEDETTTSGSGDNRILVVGDEVKYRTRDSTCFRAEIKRFPEFRGHKDLTRNHTLNRKTLSTVLLR